MPIRPVTPTISAHLILTLSAPLELELLALAVVDVPLEVPVALDVVEVLLLLPLAAARTPPEIDFGLNADLTVVAFVLYARSVLAPDVGGLMTPTIPD